MPRGRYRQISVVYPPQVILLPPSQQMMTVRVFCARRAAADSVRRITRVLMMAPVIVLSWVKKVDLSSVLAAVARDAAKGFVAPHLANVELSLLGLPPPGETCHV